MKTMTYHQLGGACDTKFHAETFEEMAKLSQKHGVEMFEKGDAAHLTAMGKMQAMIQSPEDMNEWINAKPAEFDALPYHQ